MRKMMVTLIIVSSFSLVFAEQFSKKLQPSWLLDNSKYMHSHAVQFLYSSKYGSFRSLYTNHLSYRVSPTLTLTGSIGYYRYGMVKKNHEGMLHGFGLEFKPYENLLFRFQYGGVTLPSAK